MKLMGHANAKETCFRGALSDVHVQVLPIEIKINAFALIEAKPIEMANANAELINF